MPQPPRDDQDLQLGTAWIQRSFRRDGDVDGIVGEPPFAQRGHIRFLGEQQVGKTTSFLTRTSQVPGNPLR